ncbi:MAG TPA: hypothetical protein VGB91_06670, partial [Rhizomicrobium sp.]
AEAADLVARYPRDPRAHLYRGIAFLIDGHDYADAEEQFRRARATGDLPGAGLDPDFDKTVTVLLALTVADERRPDEGRALGAPLCGFADEKLPDLADGLRRYGICGD